MSSDPFAQYIDLLLRSHQLTTLSHLYHPSRPFPPFTLLTGPQSTLKTSTATHILTRSRIPHALINCSECLSPRHLLGKIFAKAVQELDIDLTQAIYERVDNVNALTGNLRRCLDRPFVVVLEDTDAMMGLVPAFARMSEVIPRLGFVVAVNTVSRIEVRKAGVVQVWFPPYTRAEQLRVLIAEGAPLPERTALHVDQVSQKVWPAFLAVVYDTLIAPTTSDLTQFRRVSRRLWPRFVWPAIVETGTAKWDFARLLARNRILFQADGEAALQDRLLPDPDQVWTFEQLASQQDRNNGTEVQSDTILKPVQPLLQTRPLLKFNATLLLLSAFLASHTHSKHDIVLFSRLSTASSTSRRKRRYLTKSRSGGISKTPTKSPSKSDAGDFDDSPSKKRSKEVDAATATPRKERADRSMRAILEKTSSVARVFVLERLVAIYRAIHPHGLANDRTAADRVYCELSELDRLRLVMRADREIAGRRGGVAPEDLLEEKWICRAGRTFVLEAGNRYNLRLDGWEID